MAVVPAFSYLVLGAYLKQLPAVSNRRLDANCATNFTMSDRIKIHKAESALNFQHIRQTLQIAALHAIFLDQYALLRAAIVSGFKARYTTKKIVVGMRMMLMWYWS
jgi:hypothetical protein